jgi:hypothetical protein
MESGHLVREIQAASPPAFLSNGGKTYIVYCSVLGTIAVGEARTGLEISGYALPYFDVAAPEEIHSIEVSADSSLIAISYSMGDEGHPGAWEKTDVIVLSLDWS